MPPDLDGAGFPKDPRVAAILERSVLPASFGDASRAYVRAWVPKCGSGEEAYWLAILLNDYLDSRRLGCEVRVFATESDPAMLERARSAIYPQSLTVALAAERVKRHFRALNGAYQVCRRIRECVVFSAHDLRSDPPFSRLDLIFGARVFSGVPPEQLPDTIRLLHYCLVPGGHLVLGEQCAPVGTSEYFTPVADEVGVFRRRADRAAELPITRRLAARRYHIDAARPEREGGVRASIAEQTQRMILESHAPPCVVVDGDMQIVYSTGKTGRYLQAPDGTPTRDLRQMLRAELSNPVMALVQSAAVETAPQSVVLSLELDGTPSVLHVTARLLARGSSPPDLRAILFEASEAADGVLDTPASYPSASSQRNTIEHLKQELERLKAEFRSSKAGLQVSNEALRRMNEELLSTNQEIELAQMSLHIVNEQLGAVNFELRDHLAAVENTLSELRSQLESARLGLVFLDRSLRVREFTPAAGDLFSLIPADRGRPLSDIAQRFRYDNLQVDAEAVLLGQQGKEAQVQASSGRWYTLRSLPSRSPDGKVDGVVLAFADVTQLELQAQRKERLASMGVFATAIAHELNNPLSNIALNAGYAAETSDEARREKSLRSIQSNALRCGRIIESLLHLARDETTEKSTSELNPIIQRAAELVKSYEVGRHLTVVFELGDPSPSVYANPTELELVFVNLLKNAAQVSPERCTVVIRSAVAAGKARVVVSDDGPGIPVQDVEHIFEPFFSTQRARGGTGMGLCITHRIVKAHGGQIRVLSRPGDGATFEIELPSVAAEQNRECERQRDEPGESA